mgnify:CR=1 FL=1
MRFETKLLHNGNEVDPYTGAASIPIYQASTYHQFEIEKPGEYGYARVGNPTRKALEETIASLEQGVAGFAFASGMAAISTVFLLFSPGDHLLVSQDVYGGTYRVLTTLFARLGIRTSFVDTTNLKAVEQAIEERTKAIYVETPSNPILKVTDLRGIVKLAKEYQLLTIIDNTFMTPVFQNPIPLGFDIVIHSATKFIGGHSDVLAGLVVAKDASIAAKIRSLQLSFGAVLGVQDSWLLLRGIKTLQTRMKVSSASAQKIAEWLSSHPQVEQVYYTGLPTHEGHSLQASQASGHGAVLSFELGSREKAVRFMKQLKLPIVAVSLGSVESILSYPAEMSHSSMPKHVREQHGITDGLVRLSVGLEHVEDLIEDLEQALAAAK